MTLQKPSGQHIKLALIILVGAVITLVASPIYYYVRSRSFPPNPIFLINRFTSSFFLERTLTGHSNPVTSLAISPDGKTLAGGSLDDTITLWNLATGEQIRTLPSLREAAPTERYANTGDFDPVESLAISPDGKTLASASWDKTIKLWNLTTGEQIRTLPSLREAAPTERYANTGDRLLAISPDGKILASGSSDNTIKLWNLATGEQIRTLPSLREAAPTERYANTRHSNRVTSLAISPDGKILASGSSDDTIKLWNLATGEQIRTLGVVYPERYYNSVTAIPISPSVAAIGSSDNTIKLWNLATGEQIRTLPSLREAAPTERYVNTRHYNSVACQCQFRIPSVTSIAISPDGKTLASVSEFGTITLWNLATGEQIRTLAGHSGDVDSVAISPDGKILVSGGIWDKTIKLWNLTTGEEIRTLTEHSEGVTSVAISPDGKTLVSGSRDKTIKIWRLE